MTSYHSYIIIDYHPYLYNDGKRNINKHQCWLVAVLVSLRIARSQRGFWLIITTSNPVTLVTQRIYKILH